MNLAENAYSSGLKGRKCQFPAKASLLTSLMNARSRALSAGEKDRTVYPSRHAVTGRSPKRRARSLPTSSFTIVWRRAEIRYPAFSRSSG